ncbi:MAG TPA: hypothetical protein VGO47_14175 [Chlamydiales bacterium]|jgi:hypothetical protein|nr:hypothetical protein [Chlamydiales bacterium]
MAERIAQINPLDEDERSHKRSAAWGIYQQSCHPLAAIPNDAIHKRDLSNQAIGCLDRTEAAAKGSLLQTQLASPTDQIRENADVSKTRPAGTNAVIDAAESSGIIKPKIQSLFDLSGSMGKRKDASQTDTDTHAHLTETQLDATTDQIPEETGLSASANNIRTGPQLSLPKTLSEKSELEVKNYLQLILETLGSMEKVIAESTNHFDVETRKDLQELEKLREAKIAAIQTHVEELSNKESWATLQTIARYLAYASSVAIGFSVSGPAGYFLIAGGGLGLASSIASDTGLWPTLAAHFDKSVETQKHIVQSIELATTIIALGLVLFGTSMAAPTQAPVVFTWTAAALSATSKFGEGWSQKKFSDITGQIESLETKIRMKQEKTKMASKHVQDDLHKIRDMTLEVEKILSGSEIHL